MDELIARLVSNTGAEPEAAGKAVGIILNFLQAEGPSDTVRGLIEKIPGAEAAVAAAPDAEGGLMGAANQLMGVGLDMGQVQSVTKELVAYAREKLGDDPVDDLVSSIPGLSGIV